MSKPADFWSRRKAAVAEEQASEVKVRVEAEHAQERARLEEKSDAEILRELGLKDPDEMQAGDDFAAFLKAAVPDRLRRRALRRLWLSNPVLANVDSLVDYGEDYTDAATVVANLQTAIRLGRGALDRVEALAAGADGEAARDDGREVPDAEPPVPEPPKSETMEEAVETESFPYETVNAATRDRMITETGPGEANNVSESDAEAWPASPSAAGPEVEATGPRPRRMKFHFLG